MVEQMMQRKDDAARIGNELGREQNKKPKRKQTLVDPASEASKKAKQ